VQRAFSNIGLLAIIAGAIGIGFAPILVRLSDAGPSATAFWRVLIALPVLWAYLGLKRANGTLPRQPASRREWLLMICSGLFFAADLALWHWSLRLTSVTNSTLLSNIAPILVTLAAFFLFHERITSLFIAGLVLAIAGAALLVGGHFDSPHLAGDSLAVATAVFYAGYLLTIKRLRSTFDPITSMAWSGLFSCPSFLLIAVLSGDRLWPVTVQGWGAVVALGLISHLGGQTLIAYALGRLPASFSAVSLLLQPVVAAVLAWPILHEPITVRQIVGGIVVLSGIALAHQARTKAPVPPTV
jgi:drug/metabolite transporter (DMT)-like permease